MSRQWSYFGAGLPYLKENDWPGYLIVIEGADGCGRSTQIAMAKDWLERRGHAVLDTGLRRSSLAGRMITRAKRGNLLGRTTLSLLYATDLADQLENRVIPALRAGLVVLADRYIFAVMARDLARGARRDWLEKLYGFALRPDLTIYLQTTPEERLHRALAKERFLDYWEAGMDMGLAPDRVTSYLRYQALLQGHYDSMAANYQFAAIDGSRSRKEIHEQVQERIERVLERG
ncbi:MAG TPA: thymidylate kinase [Symbiobacteriaceae bacterium]|nr:thymidylate kinase [Symbiobacteriaceae bacterium]